MFHDFDQIQHFCIFGYDQISQVQRKSDGLAVAMKTDVCTQQSRSMAPILNDLINLLPQLNHPAIVTFVGHMVNPNQLHFVFDYDPQITSLEAHLNIKEFSEEEISHCAVQIVGALGILLMPGSIIKLVNFHPITILDVNGLTSGDYCPCEDWAPEILEGGDYGMYVDWWALGVLMYYLSTKDNPFNPSAHLSWLENPILTQRVMIQSHVTKGMQQVIYLLLKKEPTEHISSEVKLRNIPFYANV
ncbi:uncharacterized protein MELLADRAFT_93332 [Melampsora larici-populina 98AG31]|uniref:Protein kinase domain-containing protein n=1 Tax=Melampsora larici-populina (strain 98AG31 / pathotype 3-4-7) TaxID=747676 RepID=F4S4T4_MELLP|nr:uncharacterized protein MELLADRAFT_93332 [Melampsora larici-populina 98AG31]EGG00372.1 hypothetical protein MELLADRAFT_93332 [Melampsora larici-populina 98AG31]